MIITTESVEQQDNNIPVIYPDNMDPNLKYKFVPVMVPKEEVYTKPEIIPPEEKPLDTVQSSGRIEFIKEWAKSAPKQTNLNQPRLIGESYSEFIDDCIIDCQRILNS